MIHISTTHRILFVAILALSVWVLGGINAEAATSQLWGVNGELWDSSSRLPDFSYAGYKSGESQIPDLPVVTDVTNFGAVPNDSGDDTAAINAAIRAASNGAVYMPPGRYIVTGYITLDKSNVVLRGAGAGQTTLYFPKHLTDAVGGSWYTYPSGTYFAGRRVSQYSWGGGFMRMRGDFSTSNETNITAAVAKGSRDIQVASTNGFSVGQYVEISASNDSSHSLTKYLIGGLPTSQSGNGNTIKNTGLEFVARISAINSNTVTLDRPLLTELRTTWNPKLSRFSASVQNVGMEGFKIEFPGTQYPGGFEELGYNAMNHGGVMNCWLRGIHFHNMEAGIYAKTRFCTFQDLLFTADSSKQQPGRSGDWLYDYRHNVTSDDGISLGVADNLIVRADFQTKFQDEFTTSDWFHLNVVADSKGVDVGMDQHKQLPYANLYTNIDTGAANQPYNSGGSAPRGPNTGNWITWWNVTGAKNIGYPPMAPGHYGGGSWPYGPDNTMNVVGVKSSGTGVTDINGRWHEVFATGSLQPENIHRAQFMKRTGQDHPAYGGLGGFGTFDTSGNSSGAGIPQGFFSADLPDSPRPIDNLIGDDTFKSTSLNTGAYGPVDRLWDACVQDSSGGCVTGTGRLDTFWVEFDLGEVIKLGVARIFGDTEGGSQTRSWKLEYKVAESDPWIQVGSEIVVAETNWIETYVGEEAQFIKVTFTGTGTGGVQVRELEVFRADDPRNQTGVSATFNNIRSGFTNLFNTIFPFGNNSGSGQSVAGNTTVAPSPQGVPGSTGGATNSQTTSASAGNILTTGMITRSSDNFRVDRGPEKLLDDCFGDQDITCMTGNVDIGSFWVEFDLGEPHILESAQLYGDTFGTWVSTAWTIEYRRDDSSPWSVIFRDADAYGNQWFIQPLADVEAQHVRLTVTGDTEISRTQAREFELFATPASGAVVTPPTPGVPGSAGGTTNTGGTTGGTSGGTPSGNNSSGGVFGFLGNAWQTGTSFIGGAVNNLLSYFNTPSASGVIFLDTFDEDSKAGPVEPNPVLGLGYSTNYPEAHPLSKWTKWDSRGPNEPTQGFWVIPPGETYMVQAGRSARSVLFANTPVPPGTLFYDIQFDQWVADNDYIGYIINAPSPSMSCVGGGCDSGGVEFGYQRQTPGTDDWVEEGHVRGDLGERVVPGIGIPHRFQWKSHRIEVRGTSVSWYIDNELIISGVVPDMPSGGYFGIRQQFDRNTRYDNVVITRVDVPPGFFAQQGGGTTGGTTGGTVAGIPPAPPTGNYVVDSNNVLRDPNGNAFIVKGTNLFPWQHNLLDEVKNCWNFNTVRINYQPHNDPSLNTEAMVIEAVQKVRDLGMVAIVDWHVVSGTDRPNGRQAIVEFFGRLAERFKDDPGVWYEPYNEPGGRIRSTDHTNPWEHTQDDEGWIQTMTQTIDRIRSTGAEAPIIVTGLAWGQDLTVLENWNRLYGPHGNPTATWEDSSSLMRFAEEIRGGRSNIIFSMHVYDNFMSSGGAQWFDEYMSELARRNIYIIIGEYGVDNHNGVSDLGVRTVHDHLDQFNFGRIVWTYAAHDQNNLTTESNQNAYGSGGGDQINSCTNPTNLSLMGQLVWDDNHTTVSAPVSSGGGSPAVPAPSGGFSVDYSAGVIRSANGNVFVPKGVSIWETLTGNNHLESIKSCWDFNTVRVPSYFEGLFNYTHAPSQDTWEIFDKYLAEGFVVIGSPHEPGIGDYANDYPGHKDDLLNYVRQVAQRYKNNPNVWIALYNEWGNRDSVSRGNEWVRYHQDAIRVVRDEVGANNIIIVSGGWWGQDSGGWGCQSVDESGSVSLDRGEELITFGGKTYNNILFDVHLYEQWECNTASRLNQYINRMKDKELVPIVLEFGEDNGQNTGLSLVNNIHGTLNAQNTGRVAWHWSANRNHLTTTGNGSGINVNSCSNPTNLTDLGRAVWNDTH